jgi:hypothetical protein
MKSIPVIASARSRLHADVMLIRLRRASISIDQISACFPAGLFPNSVACWLDRGKLAPLHLASEPYLIAGPMRHWLRHRDAADFAPAAIFQRSKIEPAAAARLEEELRQGHILVCVHASDEAEAAIAWHVFRHAEAEQIALAPLPATVASMAEEAPLVFPSFDTAIPA